jgi:ATP-dependent Clp protease ATP-binding subunit ClpA
MIGATTLSEYKEYIQEDEALSRRFRTVHVEEPSIEETRRILYNIRPRLERNYSVRLVDEAIETALEMSPRYQRHLHLPDKVIGWLDTAAVRAEIDRPLGSHQRRHHRGHLARGADPKDMVFRDVGDRFKEIEHRLAKRVIGQKKAVEAIANRLVLNKGPAEGRLRSPGRCPALPRADRRRQDRARQGRRRVPVRRRQENDSDRHVRVPGRRRVGRQADWHAARDSSAASAAGLLTNQLKDNPCSVVLFDEIEKASPSPAQPVPAGIR